MIKNYGTNLKKLFKDLEKSKLIKIDNREYKELVNISYEIVYNKKLLTKDIVPETTDDQMERGRLMIGSNKCIDLIKGDIHTRRGTYCNLYSENLLGKCISLVQIFVRNKKIFINEYYRSQESYKNFKYDCQTACLLMEKLIHELKLKPGKITVVVMSFHKTVKNDK